MPGVGSVQSSEVTAAISRAASRTGVDFDFLIAQARIESGLNPHAQARTSSARGLYQFIDSTWLRTVDRHGAKHGLGWAEDAVNGGRVSDPALYGQVMALRDNPDAAALMAAELALDNRDGLRATLGREPDNSELYLAHFLGLGGAQTFLSALASNPAQPAAHVNPAAARANRAIFYEGARARSVIQVMDVVREKMASASQSPSGQLPEYGPTRQFANTQASLRPSLMGRDVTDSGSRPASMAETLRATFGEDMLASRGGTQIAAAYGKFRSFAL